MAINYSELKRGELINILQNALDAANYETLTVKANVIAVPVVLDDEDKTEGTFTITVTYKKGSREGELYDPYTEAPSPPASRGTSAPRCRDHRVPLHGYPSYK